MQWKSKINLILCCIALKIVWQDCRKYKEDIYVDCRTIHRSKENEKDTKTLGEFWTKMMFQRKREWYKKLYNQITKEIKHRGKRPKKGRNVIKQMNAIAATNPEDCLKK